MDVDGQEGPEAHVGHPINADVARHIAVLLTACLPELLDYQGWSIFEMTADAMHV